jgi:large subunit ribosomal protein L5
MATKQKQPSKGGAPGKGEKGDKGGKAPKGGAPKGGAAKTSAKSGGSGAQHYRAEHGNAGQAAPTPRLRTHYEQVVRGKLQQELGLKNVHQIPKIEKVVINVGLGEALKQPKLLDSIVNELEAITGQRPVRTKAKKSISNFGLRQGQEIGASVTLRGPRMWEFLDRLFNVAMPRIRDFRGIQARAFDGRGNFSIGLKEQVIFPEINYDQVEQVHGMDITFVTSTTRDDHAFALLRELGLPFRAEGRGAAKRLTA